MQRIGQKNVPAYPVILAKGPSLRTRSSDQRIACYEGLANTFIPYVSGLSSRLHALHSAAWHANQNHEHILASHSLIPDRRND